MARINDELKACAARAAVPSRDQLNADFGHRFDLGPIDMAMTKAIPKHFGHPTAINTNAKHIQII